MTKPENTGDKVQTAAIPNGGEQAFIVQQQDDAAGPDKKQAVNPPAEHPFCERCGSANVVRDAWAGWDRTARQWTLHSVFDHARCGECDRATRIEWRDSPPDRTTRIRRLNDALRKSNIGNGHVMITAGIQALSDAFVARCRAAVAAFDAFESDNDPYQEHDFGSVTVDGEKVFFKLDCYNTELELGSPDPADPKVTRRVLTIMLASEY